VAFSQGVNGSYDISGIHEIISTVMGDSKEMGKGGGRCV
jgi:hypothetical protein